MKKKFKLRILQLISFIISVAPLLVTFFINLDEYTKNVSATVKLTVGGVIALGLLGAKALGRAMPRGILLATVAFVLAYLLQAILHDLVLFLGMYLLGACLDAIFLQGYIKKYQEDMLIDRAAEANAVKMEEVIKKYVGGRV